MSEAKVGDEADKRETAWLKWLGEQFLRGGFSMDKSEVPNLEQNAREFRAVKFGFDAGWDEANRPVE